MKCPFSIIIVPPMALEDRPPMALEDRPDPMIQSFRKTWITPSSGVMTGV